LRDEAIAQTRRWISQVVVACNFCPFAAREVKLETIRYRVVLGQDPQDFLVAFVEECQHLDREIQVETTLLIFPEALEKFDDYLGLLAEAEFLLERQGYEGVYQVASFHPEYRFADADAEDAANYTNRSPHPMLHLLREERVEQALQRYPNPEKIPENNVEFARQRGVQAMRALREACL
jgi:hypothetical protein